MSEQYGWKFLLDDVDITDKVVSFSITTGLDQFCRELSFELADEDLFDTFDFSIIPETPRVEVLTRINDDVDPDEYDYVWISQGLFFIERPTFRVGVNDTITGIWGRQSTAILSEPFAQKMTKLWESDTTFFAICEEIIEAVGLTWDSTKCDVSDFEVFADNFEADNLYPIEVLKSLTELIVGEEGFVTSDRLGNIWIKRLVREPDTSDYNLTDSVIQSLNDEPQWPEFGNRIKIIPSETVSQNSMEITTDGECIGADISHYIEIYGQAVDGNSDPINDVVVKWTFDPAIPKDIWYKYPGYPGNMTKEASQNTATILVSNERKRASGVSLLEVAFVVDSVVGIWAYSDKERTKNFAPVDGYTTEGKNIYLTEEVFDFCDQMVFASYYAKGMVKNTVVYSAESYEDPDADILYGDVNIIGSLSGKDGTKLLYVDNSCKCTTSLSVTADPTSIVKNESSSTITAYLENSGYPVTGLVRMTEVSGKGTLSWSEKQTETILISGEKTNAVNDIVGQTQCILGSTITSVSGVWQVDVDGNKTGNNLYSSFYGRTIDLTIYVLTGTELLVDYYRAGSAINYLTGTAVGVSRVDTSVDVDTEAGLMQSIQISISDAAPSPTPTPDPGPTPPTPPPAETYTLSGPGAVSWSTRPYPAADSTIVNWINTPQSFGSYSVVRSSDGKDLGSVTLVAQGTGFVQSGKPNEDYNSASAHNRSIVIVPDGHYFSTNYQTPTQTIKVTCTTGKTIDTNYQEITATMDVAYQKSQ